jgi:hypothetical protein
MCLFLESERERERERESGKAWLFLEHGPKHVPSGGGAWFVSCMHGVYQFGILKWKAKEESYFAGAHGNSGRKCARIFTCCYRASARLVGGHQHGHLG